MDRGTEHLLAAGEHLEGPSAAEGAGRPQRVAHQDLRRSLLLLP